MTKRALISVTDKTGIVQFARFLSSQKIHILSTGGTAKLLRKHKVPVTDVSTYTGVQESLGGRVKTLHPKIFGGVLFERGNKEHEKEAQRHGYTPIDIVVVNLYEFEKTAKTKIADAEKIEQIDIGGPSLLRAAAKNHASVTVVVDPKDYISVQREIKKTGAVSLPVRRALAAKVFKHTAQYDTHIASFFDETFAGFFWNDKVALRYGENPYQRAAFYKNGKARGHDIAHSKQHQGKQLSYNNILDADLAFELVKEFSEPAVSIIKHATPCGAALGKSVLDAYKKAYAADTKSPFGGVVALNRECDEKTAKELVKIFLEIIIAPSYSQKALAAFAVKKNLRVLETGGVKFRPKQKMLRSVAGGLLVQDANREKLLMRDIKSVTKKKASKTQKEDMLFGWHLIKHVRSNAIVLVKNKVAVGIGAGQTSRVDAVEIACKKAGKKAKGAVLVSDAF
ncbi:MAG: bifunctional phosphoribosylaminoimidazolecarboxamide formyltransferase/IMP cyclohydrolase, partial [bacterium]|nr:bifunctional phosphoribosylaminoimidazolecarboxamide formyltransferase/IMP cyclohydrolase [bacterium]